MSETNEVPISSNKWVAPITFKQEKIEIHFYEWTKFLLVVIYGSPGRQSNSSIWPFTTIFPILILGLNLARLYCVSEYIYIYRIERWSCLPFGEIQIIKNFMTVRNLQKMVPEKASKGTSPQVLNCRDKAIYRM